MRGGSEVQATAVAALPSGSLFTAPTLSLDIGYPINSDFQQNGFYQICARRETERAKITQHNTICKHWDGVVERKVWV